LIAMLAALLMAGCPTPPPGDDDDDNDDTADDDDTGDDDTGDDDTGDDDTGDDDTGDDDTGDDDTAPVDADGDGYAEDVDCDDGDPDVHPDAEEVCDDIDNDCDGLVDGGDPDVPDDDGDGSSACNDCDDADPANFPDNDEVCDGQDNDCDGDIDSADSDIPDDDGDGVGLCEDCDDADPDIHPGHPELCDGIDNDCDGLVDGGDPDVPDVDADGVSECDDCDDAEPDAYPGNAEVCDGIDNDCDGDVDSDDADIPDGDGDGADECVDCDDANPDNHPLSPEFCDGIDNDCDGLIDSDDPDVPDGDLDGYDVCEDCDDADSTAFPGAREGCGGIDNNCDGVINDYTTILPAIDGSDDFIDAEALTPVACSSDVDLGNVHYCYDEIGGHVQFKLLSHNVISAVNQEIQIRIDLDGVGDWHEADYTLDTWDDDVQALTGMLYDMDPVYWVPIALADPFDYTLGSSHVEMGFFHGKIDFADEIWVHINAWCESGVGIDFAPDLDPDTPWLHIDLPDFCEDADGDGSFVGGGFCGPADCDDGSLAAYPGNAEDCFDGIDNDCDGLVDEDEDDDGDGFTNCDGDCDDDDPDLELWDADGDGHTTCDGDCDDNEPDIYPGAPEPCSGIDYDCDGAPNDFTSILPSADPADDYVDQADPTLSATCDGEFDLSDVQVCADEIDGTLQFRLVSHVGIAAADQEMQVRIDLDGSGAWYESDFALDTYNADQAALTGAFYDMDPVPWDQVQDADPFEYTLGTDHVTLGFDHGQIGFLTDIWVTAVTVCSDYLSYDFAPDLTPDTDWVYVELN